MDHTNRDGQMHIHQSDFLSTMPCSAQVGSTKKILL